eukprot:TRINITY_DN444_c0_g1_i1.p1 TRINITY_DN444_c0_g1~~TRINITY_DN444_c0_g1_i1.p1  ORF type:complete len:249 (-),score=50.24 TRINITY_DN444_c0_g1_i1:271-1017(-)
MRCLINSFFILVIFCLSGQQVVGQCELGSEVTDISLCEDITSELILQIAEGGNAAVIADGLSFSEEIGSAIATAIAEAILVAEESVLETIAQAVADAATVHTVDEELGQEHTEAAVEAVALAFATEVGITFAEALGKAAVEGNCSAIVHVVAKALAETGESIADAAAMVESACMISMVKDVMVECSPTTENCTALIASGCCVEAIMSMPVEDYCSTLYTKYTYKGVCEDGPNQVLLRPGFGSECLCTA